MKNIGLRTILPVLCVVILGVGTSTAAVRGNHAMYVGGTVADLGKEMMGKLDLTGEINLIFIVHKEHRLAIPFSRISSIEYGQHAGRRIRAVLLGGGWPLLFSHKRRHYLSLGFKDEAGKDQAVVFELAKHTVRTTLATLKARTGKEVEFDSDDAKKNID
jgi:hypothetical protein